MDQLRDYLDKSKSKRYSSVKKANKILKKIERTEKSLTGPKQPSRGFPSVTPKNFKKYEQNLTQQIKDIFYPYNLQSISTVRHLSVRSKKETYGAVYLQTLKSPSRPSSGRKLLPKQFMLDLQKKISQKLNQKKEAKHLSFQDKLHKKNRSLDHL